MPLNENFSGYFIGGVADMVGPALFLKELATLIILMRQFTT